MPIFARSQLTPARGARVLAPDEWPQALEIAKKDPVSYVLAITHIQRGITLGIEAGEIWGFPATGPLQAVCWAGANLIPIVPDIESDRELKVEALAAFGAIASQSAKRSSSIVGPSHLVLALWNELKGSWRRPREIRASQPSMVMTRPSTVTADDHVRPVEWNEFDLVLPASVHMFIEEVGISPLSFGSAQYSLRVRELIADRRTLMRLGSTVPRTVRSAESLHANNSSYDRIVTATGQELPQRDVVAFKADYGAVIPQVAQIQGVWVHPMYRGQGLAVPAMSAVVEYGLKTLAPCVSLYVNDYNIRAVKTYERVGFEHVGEYATVLF